MSFTMHATGWRFLAGMLAGSPDRINGIYVEYGTSPDGPRDAGFYRNLACDGVSGYARIAVTSSYVDADNRVHFDGLLSSADVHGTKAPVSCATLVHMKDGDPDGDTIVCTVPFSADVYVAPAAMLAVHTSMKLGV